MSEHTEFKCCRSTSNDIVPSSSLTLDRMELTRKAGNEPPLVGLMRVYKDYYPDVIVGEAISGRASVFTVESSCYEGDLTEIYSIRTKNGERGLATYND